MINMNIKTTTDSFDAVLVTVGNNSSITFEKEVKGSKTIELKSPDAKSDPYNLLFRFLKSHVDGFVSYTSNDKVYKLEDKPNMKVFFKHHWFNVDDKVTIESVYYGNLVLTVTELSDAKVVEVPEDFKYTKDDRLNDLYKAMGLSVNDVTKKVNMFFSDRKNVKKLDEMFRTTDRVIFKTDRGMLLFPSKIIGDSDFKNAIMITKYDFELFKNSF